jgi:hypothetical protein
VGISPGEFSALLCNNETVSRDVEVTAALRSILVGMSSRSAWTSAGEAVDAVAVALAPLRARSLRRTECLDALSSRELHEALVFLARRLQLQAQPPTMMATLSVVASLLNLDAGDAMSAFRVVLYSDEVAEALADSADLPVDEGCEFRALLNRALGGGGAKVTLDTLRSAVDDALSDFRDFAARKTRKQKTQGGRGGKQPAVHVAALSSAPENAVRVFKGTCHRCHKPGHMARDCRAPLPDAGAATAPNRVNLKTKSEGYVDLFAICRDLGLAAPRQFRALVVPVAVRRGAEPPAASRSAQALLDSGAQVSGCDARALKDLFAWAELEPIDRSDPLLRGAGGARLRCSGKLRDVRVRVGSCWLVVPTLYVIDGLRYPLLIGINDVVSRKTDFAVRRCESDDELEIRIGPSGWVRAERLRERRPQFVRERPPRHFDRVSVEAVQAGVAPVGADTEAQPVVVTVAAAEAAPVTGVRAAPSEAVAAKAAAEASATASEVLAFNDELRLELGATVAEAVREHETEEPLGVSLPMSCSAFAEPQQAARSATEPSEVEFNRRFKEENKEAARSVTFGPACEGDGSFLQMCLESRVFAHSHDHHLPPLMNTEVVSDDGVRISPAPIILAAGASRSAAARRPYHIRGDDAAFLEETRRTWLAEGRIRPARNPTAAAHAFVVRKTKEDGSVKRRLVQAHNESNDKTLGSAFPMPDPTAILNDLAAGRYFCAFDALAGFHGMPLARGSGPNCCIVFDDGVLYEPCILPMGTATAPQHFGEQMRRVFEHSAPAWRVRVFQDDIMGSADSREALREMLAWIVARAVFFNVTFSAKKCEVGVERIVALGAVVSHGSIEAKRSYLEAVSALSRPTTAHELRQLLGKVQWVLAHLPDAVEPLHVLAGAVPSDPSKGKSQAIDWTDERAAAFEALKAALHNTRALVPFDASRPVVLITDASAVGGGAVLGHPNAATGGIDVVDMMSHKLTDTETRYPVAERELLMLRIAALADHWAPYLRGRTVFWVTDSKPMAQLLRSARLSDRQRLRSTILDLVGLRIVCVYVRGEVNQAADALSRLALGHEGSSVKEDEQLEVAGQEEITVGAVVAQWATSSATVGLVPFEETVVWAVLAEEEEEEEEVLAAGVAAVQATASAVSSLDSELATRPCARTIRWREHCATAFAQTPATAAPRPQAEQY